MQEEVENRTLTMMVNGSKFTGRMFKAAIAKYMAHRKEVKHQKQQKREAPVIPHGKQTVKQLIGQDQGVSNIELTDPSIRQFDRIARKYGVDYAIKRVEKGKYLLFFKAKQVDAITGCFSEYSRRMMNRGRDRRVPLREQLKRAQELVRDQPRQKERTKEAEREER